MFRKVDLVGRYPFLNLPVSAPDNVTQFENKKIINWFIPPFAEGSGGHLNIFRFISLLETRGYTCRVIIVGDDQGLSPLQAKERICKWFFPIKAEVYVDFTLAPLAYISMATGWQTAYYVNHIKKTRHKCYFVQDFEPWFYPAGTEAISAEKTYHFGFTGITAGQWLSYKLNQEYKMRTFPIGFSYDKNLYYPVIKQEPNVRRVFFYVRPPTARRGFELGILTLAEVVKYLAGVEVVLAGWDVSEYAIPFAHLNAGIVSVAKLAQLYGQCDVALVLSFSNLSLLPLELMACGIPVVSNRAAYCTWLLSDDNAKLVEPTINALAGAICELLEQPQERERLRQGGFLTARATNWAIEADKLSHILLHLDENLDRVETGGVADEVTTGY